MNGSSAAFNGTVAPKETERDLSNAISHQMVQLQNLLPRLWRDVVYTMSLASILEQLPNLSPSDLHALRERIDDLDREGWQDDLSSDEQRAILERLEKARQHPETLVSWEAARERLQSEHGAW